MKGCIIQNEEISIKDIYNYIKGLDRYNWLITNIECYPSDKNIIKVLNGKYCWIAGKDLLYLLNKENFQWIWGVFSAFHCEINLKEILNYELPYADGYTGFWKNPVSIQHPLANTEIVAWDNSLLLVISKKNKIIEKIIKNKEGAIDLETYNVG